MLSRTVFISGANGLIGSHLVRYFSRRSWKVVAFARSWPKELAPIPNVLRKTLVLPDEIQENDFEEGGYFVHCAYSKHSNDTPNSDSINIEGTKNLLSITRKHRFKKFLFFSSMSAHKDAQSHYGRNKLAVEASLNPETDLIICPGLVIGAGGLFKSMEDILTKSLIIPLIGGGHQPLQTIEINDLCKMTEMALLKSELAGRFVWAERDPISIKVFYRELALANHLRRLFIPIPFWPVFWILKVLDWFNISTSISIESLFGLKHLRRYETEEDLKAVGFYPKSFRETLKELKFDSNSDR